MRRLMKFCLNRNLHKVGVLVMSKVTKSTQTRTAIMKPQLEITCNVFGAARAYFEETILECEKLAHFPGIDLSQMEQTVRTRGIEQSRLLLQGVADSVSSRFESGELLGADGIVRQNAAHFCDRMHPSHLGNSNGNGNLTKGPSYFACKGLQGPIFRQYGSLF